jgi:PAS domain S-box-containing protein
LYANQAFLSVFGYENIEELKASPPLKHYTPESHVSYVLRNERILQGEPVPDKVEVDIIRKDGAIRHLQLFRKEVLWDGKQQYQILYDDITERKQAEEELKASEQNFRNSIDSSSFGIRISDIDNHTLYANQTLLDIFGYNNIDEVIAKSPQDYYSPESYAEYLAMREKHGFGEVIPDQVDIDIIRKDGAVRHLQASFKIVLWNGKKQYQTQYNDITARKKMEEALRESEEKYRLIVENTRDIIFTVNAREEYVYVSPSVKGILGYNPTELIGKLFLSLVHPEDRHILEEETARAGVSGHQTSGDSEYRTRHASGEWRWVVSRGTRVMDANGNFLYFIGIIRDITAYKRAEKEKQILEEKAQINSRLAAVGEMAAGIAHEINNPLTGVLGFSQMLLENKNVPEDIKENLKLIADGSQRVAEIVKRLLTFARQSKPIKAMANLNELIENTLKLREYVLKTNNINVVTRFDPELPWSVVDPGQMQQVFLNLIVNAEQAMKKAHGKGTLTITTKKIDNNIRILFHDDGPGITAENMGHLFEPFFTTKEPGEGTGLGLSLSRSIVLEHDGKMNVESEFGRGAIFIIDLPIIEALLSEAETAASSVKAQPEATKPGRILVIDDEAGVRTLIEKTLTRMGHSVDVIDDARAALDIIDAGTVYDVILTDVRMPGMSGIELYPLIIRRMPSMKNRIIFITGDVMGLDIRTFLNQNNLPYLSKPFDIELLKEKIAAILKSGQERPDIKCKE